MVIRTLARPLLAAWFIYGAVESILEPQRRAATAAPLVAPALKEAQIEVSVADLVRAHGVASLLAATSLAFSKNPRTSALALAGLTTFTVALGRPFWREADATKRTESREHFFKNVSLLGGTLIAATAGEAHHKPATKRAAAERAAKKSNTR